MSKIKDLKGNPKYNFSVVDVIERFIPTEKTKYTELFTRLFSDCSFYGKEKEIIDNLLSNHPNFKIEDLTGLTSTQLVLTYVFYNDILGKKEQKTVKNFIDFNERNLIKNNDLQTFKTFDEIKKICDEVELRLIEKELSLEVYKIFNDDEWLIIRPLTYNASKKYGSNTKWCTTSDKGTFDRYANGILIYIINKTENTKTAFYDSLHGNEFSFWDAKDNKIDSLLTNVPSHIINIVIGHYNDCQLSNSSFYKPTSDSKDQKMTEEKYPDHHLTRNYYDNPQPIDEEQFGEQPRRSKNIPFPTKGVDERVQPVMNEKSHYSDALEGYENEVVDDNEEYNIGYVPMGEREGRDYGGEGGMRGDNGPMESYN